MMAKVHNRIRLYNPHSPSVSKDLQLLSHKGSEYLIHQRHSPFRSSFITPLCVAFKDRKEIHHSRPWNMYSSVIMFHRGLTIANRIFIFYFFLSSRCVPSIETQGNFHFTFMQLRSVIGTQSPCCFSFWSNNRGFSTGYAKGTLLISLYNWGNSSSLHPEVVNYSFCPLLTIFS